MSECIKCGKVFEVSKADAKVRHTLKNVAKLVVKIYPVLAVVLENEQNYCNECFKEEVNGVAKGIIK